MRRAFIQRPTQDRHGPAAAWLVDEHTDRLEDILDKADDPSSLVLESLDQLGLNSTGIATWARALRLQPRHLRRQIA